MEMNDILNGLNSCEDTSSCESTPDSCCCGGPNMGPVGIGAGPLGGGLGCGFGSWIWILLILFYCGCGGNGLFGGSNGSCNSCCSNNCGCNSCGCGCGGNNNGGLFGGMFGGGSCTAYLFLLVILFLCNSNGIGGGCGNSYAPLAGCGNFNLNGNYGC